MTEFNEQNVSNVDFASPASRQWFQDSRFGLFIHWGLYALTGRDMWYYSLEEVPHDHYERLFQRFDPVKYDPMAWARLAKQAGCKYAVFVSKHHDGFCLWDTKYTDFKVTNTPYGRDVLKMFVDAFRANEIKVGIYYSLLDWHHPHFTVDKLHPAKSRLSELNKGRIFSNYQRFLRDQIHELMTGYGKIDIFWADFSYVDNCADFSYADSANGKTAAAWRSKELHEMMRKLQPDILINNRMGIPGDFCTPEQYIPAEDVARAENAPMWEACETIGSSWGYCRGDNAIKPVKELIRNIVTCVSNNGNLLLNVGPTPHGIIQHEFVDTLSEIGRWLETNGESIYGAGSADYKFPQGGCPEFRPITTQKGRVLYMHCLDKYPSFRVILPGLASKVKYIECLCDGTDVEFEFSGADIIFNPPVIHPDPYDTVFKFVLR
ncbi:MAG: alpha-L-fucosidase [Planctomycetaceae bacterium]|nr:alpha-L-fucosidase [Planctomycetaceae bacterium]